jgi:hypothetical protein
MINAANAAKQATASGNASRSGGGYGSAGDWANIISGAGQGASSAMQGATAYATSKKEAKEAKRRTLANLMNQAMKRNQGLFRMGQEHQDDLNDYQSQAVQQIARGFVDALQGSTG